MDGEDWRAAVLPGADKDLEEADQKKEVSLVEFLVLSHPGLRFMGLLNYSLSSGDLAVEDGPIVLPYSAAPAVGAGVGLS